jgi:hypothetical protein
MQLERRIDSNSTSLFFKERYFALGHLVDDKGITWIKIS